MIMVSISQVVWIRIPIFIMNNVNLGPELQCLIKVKEYLS